MNIATSEFLPSAPGTYHGRNIAGAAADQHTENTFRWPHALTDRAITTTNAYALGADRSSITNTGVADTPRFDFRCMGDAVYRNPYDPVLQRQDIAPPPPPAPVQPPPNNTARYDFYDNQYSKNEFRNLAATTGAGSFLKKEQHSGVAGEMEMSFQEQRSFTNTPQVNAGITLPHPPPPIGNSNSLDQRYSPLSTFQHPASYSTRQESRLSYDESNMAMKARGYMPPFENHFSSPSSPPPAPTDMTPGVLALSNHLTEKKLHESRSLYRESIELHHHQQQQSLVQQQQPQQQIQHKQQQQQQQKQQQQTQLKEEEPLSSNIQQDPKPLSIAKDEPASSESQFNNTSVSTNDSNESTEESKHVKTPTKQEPKEETTKSTPSSNSATKAEGNGNQDNGLPSYTAMIAQAILKKEASKSTLSDIYEYMEKQFPSLEKRGTGWRNCVRHTLSLNDCFIKLHRPENGRSCNWAIHPTYYESFSRGDYRKRRALRKRPRGLQWIDPAMLAGYPFAREQDMYSDIHQQQQPSPFYPYPPPPPSSISSNMHTGSPQSYYHSSTSFNPNFSLPPQAQPQPQPQPTHNTSAIPHYPTHQNTYPPAPPQGSGHHMQSVHCTNPDCYCQYPKQSNSRLYTP